MQTGVLDVGRSKKSLKNAAILNHVGAGKRNKLKHKFSIDISEAPCLEP